MELKREISVKLKLVSVFFKHGFQICPHGMKRTSPSAGKRTQQNAKFNDPQIGLDSHHAVVVRNIIIP
jgi:hypothetical protein